MKMKYIIVAGFDLPILFHEGLGHDAVAKPFGVESAGFCNIHIVNGKIKAVAYGESTSLKLKSNPELDSMLITKLLNPE